ncbi:MAG: response regulator [Candidatus Limivivens sp.]|nr:response regulator [Candidatus Limivivens sp.]
MKTAEAINIVCSELGTTKADLAKKMGIHPSSLYRKLARESMTLEELQNCLDVLGVTIEFSLQYPDGQIRSSQVNHEMLLEKVDLLEKELETARKATEFHKKALKNLRTELSSAVGYTELAMRHGPREKEYLEKIQQVLTNVDFTIAYALGESLNNEPDPEEPESLETLEGKRVLLVDDNELNLEVMKEVLVDHGFIVEEAGNGKEAVEALKANEPGYYHFILMDIEMPVMDGFEATMKIRALPNRIRANIPIIALTANAVPKNRERAAAVGMDDFLAKPTNSARLLRSLARFQ